MTRMNQDPLDDLIAELSHMDVRPDLARRAEDIEAAREKLSTAHQGNPVAARPITDPSRVGTTQSSLIGVVISMTKKMKKAFLYGSSGLVTAGLAMVLLTQTGGDFADMPQDSITMRPGVEQGGPALRQSSKEGHATPDPQLSAPPKSTTKQELMPAPSADAIKGAPAPLGARSVFNSSVALDEMSGPRIMPGSHDRFPSADQNPVKSVAETPVSTFSIDVDTASYATTRRWLNQGRIPKAETVRIEEMVNYFSYGWPAPESSDAPFRASVANYETPWNSGTEIVRIGLQGVMPEIDTRPPLDLVFLVDTSGSMRSSDKLGLLKQSFLMMLDELRPEDRVSIVTYAGRAGTALELTPASDRAAIRNALEGLSAGGSTAGVAGLRAAYAKLDESEDRIGRVILATDGDFNVGMSGSEEMTDFIAEKRKTGSYLSVLGFGQGNYNDTLMQVLAQNGNGQAAYIDTLLEARKVLVDQLAGNLFTIAEDVKIQVEFNPSVVSEYRLIGYETRALAREDFENDKVDAGEIGAGHQVTALYEVTPSGSDAARLPALRYGVSPDVLPEPQKGDELGFLRLRYKAPGEDKSHLIEVPILKAQEPLTEDDRFALAIAGFGQHLRGGKYLEDWGMDAAIDLARNGRGEDPFGYRSEALQMMQVYQALSN